LLRDRLPQYNEQTLSLEIFSQNFDGFKQFQLEFVLFSSDGGSGTFRILLSSLSFERDLVAGFDREGVIGREVGSIDRQVNDVAVGFVGPTDRNRQRIVGNQ